VLKENHLLVALLEMLGYLPKLVHQVFQLGHSIVVAKNAIVCCAPVLLLF
jgi:hypothetical protein